MAPAVPPGLARSMGASHCKQPRDKKRVKFTEQDRDRLLRAGRHMGFSCWSNVKCTDQTVRQSIQDEGVSCSNCMMVEVTMNLS